MPAAAVLTPYSRSAAVPSGNRVWRKKLLPVASISYKGRKIDFTRDYNDRLAQAYKASAYDQVPFQLAGDENKHTNAVERFGGEIVSLDSQPDGLWLTLNATPEGDQILRTNPRLGVSARIVENYERADGQFFPEAVQHVLGTLDPRVTGLGPWESVSLSNEGVDLVIDLSDAEYPEEGHVPDFTPEQQAKLAKLLELDPASIDALAGMLAGDANSPAGPGGQGFAAGRGSEPGDDISDEELDALIAEYEAAGGDLTDDDLAAMGLEDPDLVSTGLSNEALMAIELANSRAAETEARLGLIQRRFDGEAYINERRKLAEDFGIPPYITDLARPLLEGTGHVVELSNGQGADAGAIVRRVLMEVGKMGKMLDIGPELGSAVDLSGEADDGQRVQTIQDIVKRFRTQTGA